MPATTTPASTSIKKEAEPKSPFLKYLKENADWIGSATLGLLVIAAFTLWGIHNPETFVGSEIPHPHAIYSTSTRGLVESLSVSRQIGLENIHEFVVALQGHIKPLVDNLARYLGLKPEPGQYIVTQQPLANTPEDCFQLHIQHSNPNPSTASLHLELTDAAQNIVGGTIVPLSPGEGDAIRQICADSPVTTIQLQATYQELTGHTYTLSLSHPPELLSQARDLITSLSVN